MDALAALGIVLPITLIMQAFANLVGLGCARIAAQTAATVLIEYSAFADLGKP